MNPDLEDALNRLVEYWQYEQELPVYVSHKITKLHRDWPEVARAVERIVTFHSHQHS